MPDQVAAEDPSGGVVALEHDGDAAPTQLLKEQDVQKDSTSRSLSSGAVAGIFQKDGTEWVFFFNGFNQLIYTWRPPGASAQIFILTVGPGNPVSGNPSSVAVALENESPWVFYLSTRDVLSDVFLTGTTGTTGHAWQHGRLAGQNWIASATSPIYASSHTPHGILFEVWYINLNRQWVSVGLQTNGVWRSLTQ